MVVGDRGYAGGIVNALDAGIASRARSMRWGRRLAIAGAAALAALVLVALAPGQRRVLAVDPTPSVTASPEVEETPNSFYGGPVEPPPASPDDWIAMVGIFIVIVAVMTFSRWRRRRPVENPHDRDDEDYTGGGAVISQD